MTRPEGLPPTVAEGRCLVMGVLNVTPDSFSDGGRWLDRDAAVGHALAMVSEGADLIDVGGESTRPGAARVSEDEELRRIVPVVRDVAAAGVPVSIDTMRATVAEAALEAGAALVNDVSGGNWDPRMPALLARAQVPFVAMHWRGASDPQVRPAHDDGARYHDVVAEVVGELRLTLDNLVRAGVDPDRVVLDPGLGFSKNAAHNWALLAELDALVGIGAPVLVGASRKRFLGTLLAGADGVPAGVEGRDAATTAISTLAALAGVWCVRVHAVRPSADAVRVAQAVRDARAGRQQGSRQQGRREQANRQQDSRQHQDSRQQDSRQHQDSRQQDSRQQNDHNQGSQPVVGVQPAQEVRVSGPEPESVRMPS